MYPISDINVREIRVVLIVCFGVKVCNQSFSNYLNNGERETAVDWIKAFALA
jgi:hypothetical protein